MTEPEQILTKLKEEFGRWEAVLGSLRKRKPLPHGCPTVGPSKI